MSKQNQSTTPDNTGQDNKNSNSKPAGNAPVPDSAKTTSTQTQTQTKTETRPAARHKRKKPAEHHYLAKLSLIASLIIAAAVFFLWQQQTTTIHSLDQQLAEQQNQLNSKLQSQTGSLSSLEAENRHLQDQVKQLADEQKQLSRAFRDLLKANRHLKQDWLISEAEYLVNLAGQRLGLMRDIKTAITALKAADSRLRETGNPELIAIRKALAKDINRLESVQQADLTGLSLKLSAMLGDIDHLKLLTPKPDESIMQEQKKESAEVKDWKALPAAMWRDIKKLIVIREHQGPIKPLLSPEQFFFLSQNLKLQLEQARLAMLNGEPDIYSERLVTAKTWIEKWFDTRDSKTRTLLLQLDNLMQQNIHPPLPTLNNSFAAFKTYRKNINLPDSVKSELSKPVKKVKKQPAKAKTAKPKKPVAAKPKQPEPPQKPEKPAAQAPPEKPQTKVPETVTQEQVPL